MRKVIALRIAAVLALAALVVGCGAPAAREEGIRPGLYRQRALLCTPAPGADVATACASAVQDCLLIRPQAGGALRLELFSTQTHQHVCVVSATARPDGAALRVDDPDTPGQGLRIARVDDALHISHLSPARAGLHPFCGARASLQGYRFVLSSWQAADGACVPADFK